MNSQSPLSPSTALRSSRKVENFSIVVPYSELVLTNRSASLLMVEVLARIKKCLSTSRRLYNVSKDLSTAKRSAIISINHKDLNLLSTTSTPNDTRAEALLSSEGNFLSVKTMLMVEILPNSSVKFSFQTRIRGTKTLGKWYSAALFKAVRYPLNSWIFKKSIPLTSRSPVPPLG